jgi:NMD protein affecting ribosome stability and mRNA decay
VNAAKSRHPEERGHPSLKTENVFSGELVPPDRLCHECSRRERQMKRIGLIRESIGKGEFHLAVDQVSLARNKHLYAADRELVDMRQNRKRRIVPMLVKQHSITDGLSTV